MGTFASFSLILAMCSSTLADMPENLPGSGPIILMSWGTSRCAIWQNLASARMQRNTCSSGGFPLKNCSIAIASSVQMSSKTFGEEWNGK